MSRHSNDLRQRVVDFYLKGNTLTLTTQVFQIARDTVKKWVRWKQQGQLFRVLPAKAMTKLDTRAILKYVDTHPDRYNYEIAKEFNSSRSAIQRLLAKNNYSLKKNRRGILKPIQKLERSI